MKNSWIKYYKGYFIYYRAIGIPKDDFYAAIKFDKNGNVVDKIEKLNFLNFNKLKEQIDNC